MLFFHSVAAQTTDQVRAKLDFIHALLDKSQIPTGYLWDNGYGFVKPERFNGAIQDSNAVDIRTWRFAYYSAISGFSYGTNTLPNLGTINTALAAYEKADALTLALPIFHVRYAIFKPTAYTQNLVAFQGDQLIDVPNRPASPYQIQDAFAVAPSRAYSADGQANFLFRQDMFYTNVGLSVSSLQADFADGQGYRTMAWGAPVTVTYPTAGMKRLKYRLTYTNGSIFEGQSDFQVLKPFQQNVPLYENGTRQTINIPADLATGRAAGTMVIVRSVTNQISGGFTRPLIVAEGYDPNRIAPNIRAPYTINELIREWRDLTVNPITFQTFSNLLDNVGGYDLVFIDYEDGTADIVRNAQLFEEVVRRVNTLKAASGSTEQNVVIGISMGGLVSRYGLAEMTRNGENTQTRLLITQDSPHKGANVPLGAQAITRMFAEANLPNIPFLTNNNILPATFMEAVPAIADGIRLLNAPASQQMLIVRATNTTGGFANNAFLAEGGPYRTMIDNVPNQPYQVIATSLGAECGQQLMPPHQKMLDINLQGNLGISADVGLFMPFFMMGIQWNFKAEVRALPDGGSPQMIAHLSLERKWRMFGIKTFQAYLYNNTYNSPSAVLPWDSSPGGTMIGDIVDGLPTTGANIYVNILGIVVMRAAGSLNFPSICFIPTVSALDIQQINRQSIFANHNGNYSPYQARVKRFITQEAFANGTQFNAPHPFFTARQARWIFNEMQNISNATDPSVNLCNRPCAPALPAIMLNKLLCDTGVGNQLFVNIPTGTGIVWNTSQGLSVVYQGNPSVPYLRWDGIQKGSGWVEASLLTDAGCSFPLNRVNVWTGEPSTGYQIITTVPKIGGTYVLCPEQIAKFTFVPNSNVEMGLQGFEAEAPDCATNQQTIQLGEGRTEFIFTATGLGQFDTDCVGHINVRPVNDCGNGDWTSIPFVVSNLCNLFVGGAPCPPNVLCDRLTTEAFENPFGSGFRYRLMGIPGIDYYRLTDATLAGFDYQVQVFDGQGDMKRQIQTSTVQTYINMDNLPAGNYYVRTLFSNGSYTSLRTVVKQ